MTVAVTPDLSAVSGSEERVLAVLCVGSGIDRWMSTIASLEASRTPMLVLVTRDSAEVADRLAGMGARVETWDMVGAGDYLTQGPWTAAFVVTSPVVVPHRPFESALAAIDEDLRTCSVSFYSNNANYLSFPWRNAPSGLVVNGHNEQTLTARLRAAGQASVPIPVPAGGAVLVAAAAVRALGGFDRACSSPEVAVLDLALRGIRRGFRNVLDRQTFLVRPVHGDDAPEALNDEATRGWLHQRHRHFPALLDHERDSDDNPLADALAADRCRVVGMRVLVDGSVLGPYEMGTQVALLSQVDALVRHPGVREVVVATRGGQIPRYAVDVLMQPGVTICETDGHTFTGAGQVDVLHRPFQSGDPVPIEHWRSIARRVVVTVHDLIAYDNGAYHDTPAGWLAYRDGLRTAVRHADAIVAISQDTAETIRRARMPYPADGLAVVPNGTDHLRGPGPREDVPLELLESGSAAADFILVLGAAYAHKNRDLAIRAWHELTARGESVKLVLAGVVVPFGSSRNDEAMAAARGGWPLTLADVTTAERDWLMRHAKVVLYATSAEGFGLVPFEAAAFGTPCVFVSFGPLAEALGDVPVVAAEWSPGAVADAVQTVLHDPDVAAAQIAAVRAVTDELTWEHNVDALVEVYQQALARPASR